jgi:hypothetical protein
MKHNAPNAARYFTVDEANATLPLVRAITRDLMEKIHEMVQTRTRLDFLKSQHRGESASIYQDELMSIEHTLEEEAQGLDRYVQELLELGVEPKGLIEGLVDFPALREGQPVYLCWKYDEPSVMYWHRTDDGFAGRRPIETFDPQRCPVQAG